MNQLHLRRKAAAASTYIFLSLAVVIVLLPAISMVCTSFKSPDTIMSSLSIFPEKFSLYYYINVLEKSNFLIYLKNSFFVAVTVSACSTLLSIFGGYALSRYRKKVKGIKIYIVFLLVLQMFPVVQLIIPLYLTFQRMGITNTHLSVLIAYSTFTLPLNLWMMQSFFDGIPFDIEEAGTIDGCGRLQCLFRLILPVSGPGLASIAIFAFNYCWNEYLLGSLLLKTDTLRTLTIGLQSFMQEHTTDWGSLMAASTLAIVPVLIFLIFMQKHIVSGLTAGTVKG